jgi:UDP-N-acetylmuramoyl-tripeptide--D-alanyl-D-alanine ligase
VSATVFLNASQSATGIATDTRELKSGEIFVALKGENFNGHSFIEQAIAQGAIAAIVDTEISIEDPRFPLIRVTDTLKAYQAIAHWWRNQFNQPVIAVTGSVGKTTTKELIAAVLSTQGAVLKSQANFNNEIGVPKTLLQLTHGHDYAIVEMGMRGSGEIALLAQIARPDIAVITNVGTAHIGRLGSEAAIARAKCELLAEMPTDSIAILNHDDLLLRQTAATVWQGRTLTFGLEGGDIRGEVVNASTLLVEKGLNTSNLLVEKLQLPLPLPGQHNALNYLAALAVARSLRLDWSILVDGLSLDLPGGRARRYELPNDIVILDETYNAGLESMIAALHLLAEAPGKRRIAVLGTMKELGERSPEFHFKVGETVRRLGLDQLLILADEPEAIALAQGASSLPTERFLTHTDLVDYLKQQVKPGDRLLFKASRAVALDQVIEPFRISFNA